MKVVESVKTLERAGLVVLDKTIEVQATKAKTYITVSQKLLYGKDSQEWRVNPTERGKLQTIPIICCSNPDYINNSKNATAKQQNP